MEFQHIPVETERAKQMSPVVLAFVGDAVYTLLVRRQLALSSGYKTGELNKQTALLVSAHGQSERIDRLLPRLTEEESEIITGTAGALQGGTINAD